MCGRQVPIQCEYAGQSSVESWGVRAGGLNAIILLRVIYILKPVSCFFLEFSIYCFQIIVAERKNTIKYKKKKNGQETGMR